MYEDIGRLGGSLARKDKIGGHVIREWLVDLRSDQYDQYWLGVISAKHTDYAEQR